MNLLIIKIIFFSMNNYKIFYLLYSTFEKLNMKKNLFSIETDKHKIISNFYHDKLCGNIKSSVTKCQIFLPSSVVFDLKNKSYSKLNNVYFPFYRWKKFKLQFIWMAVWNSIYVSKTITIKYKSISSMALSMPYVIRTSLA